MKRATARENFSEMNRNFPSGFSLLSLSQKSLRVFHHCPTTDVKYISKSKFFYKISTFCDQIWSCDGNSLGRIGFLCRIAVEVSYFLNSIYRLELQSKSWQTLAAQQSHNRQQASCCCWCAECSKGSEAAVHSLFSLILWFAIDASVSSRVLSSGLAGDNVNRKQSIQSFLFDCCFHFKQSREMQQI